MPPGYSSIFKFIHVLLTFFWKSLRILFLPYLSNLRTRNEFTDLLFNVCSHYISSREDSSLFRLIREPAILSYIIDLCSSFAARDCNACFSQILRKEHLVVSMKRKREFS